MAAQQFDGLGSPDTVTDTAPLPDLVVVESPARRTAVTVVVEVNVSEAWTRRPVMWQVKEIPVIAAGAVVDVDGVGVVEVDDDEEVDGRGVGVVEDGAGVVEDEEVDEVEAGDVGPSSGNVAVAVGTPVLVGTADVEVAGRVQVGSSDVDPGVDVAATAAVAARPESGMTPRSNENAPQPMSARTTAKIPRAPTTDIERSPPGPPAFGGRWRPTPGSTVMVAQDTGREVDGGLKRASLQWKASAGWMPVCERRRAAIGPTWPGRSLSDGYARFVNLDREWKAAFLRVVVVAGLLVGGVPASVSADAGPSAAQARAGEWWLDALGVSKAQQAARGQGVTVCIVDSAFDGTHPDLVGADFALGADLSAGRGVIGFYKDHGTSMATLVVGQGSGPGRAQGILGVAPAATVRGVMVSLEDGPTVAGGLKACADLGASVISVSLGGTVDRAAVAYAQARDAVVVAATGNNGSTEVISDLAGQWGVVGVTGVDSALKHDPRAASTGATFPIRDVDPNPDPSDRGGTVVAGPYSRTASTSTACDGMPLAKFGGGYVKTCGTSGATAIVAGVVALVRSAHPDLNAANVVNRLVRTARPMGAASVPSVPLGFGVVDAYAAVSADVPVVEHSPLGSCYTGGRGVWDVRVKPTRAEPPVGSRLAPAPWKDPIADVSAGPRASASGGSSVGAGVAVGPVSGSGLLGFPVLAWVLLGVVLVVGSLIVAVVSITKRRSPTSR